MRVNHAGEVCAQALYRGQSLTAEHKTTREQMKQAALEEMDHLAWCNRRLDELGDSPSVLNPLWYFVSFSIGALTGLAGDRWSLGFVEETEKQVVAHLDSHLDQISDKDIKYQRGLSTLGLSPNSSRRLLHQARWSISSNAACFICSRVALSSAVKL